jgi:hypothetical protein
MTEACRAVCSASHDQALCIHSYNLQAGWDPAAIHAQSSWCWHVMPWALLPLHYLHAAAASLLRVPWLSAPYSLLYPAHHHAYKPMLNCTPSTARSLTTGDTWILCTVANDGWRPAWELPLQIVVPFVALGLSMMLLAVLVSHHVYESLVEAMLPKVCGAPAVRSLDTAVQQCLSVGSLGRECPAPWHLWYRDQPFPLIATKHVYNWVEVWAEQGAMPATCICICSWVLLVIVCCFACLFL